MSASGSEQSSSTWQQDVSFCTPTKRSTSTAAVKRFNLKRLKIYENNVLVKDFRAAVDTTDMAGLYEETAG